MEYFRNIIGFLFGLHKNRSEKSEKDEYCAYLRETLV